ncbi:short-chain dehydrogenase [Amylibacter marinus]|uniref:Short-chain dehydrogenase n=1 Tax=Amylibacter marinus TaxID=1475483 RepID=A0ABQ5VQX0_9RHOB|nr:SDR family oxidoreductase [Amylibacter marinus]GLQ33807.1 short-chain dehydrogenase [Amylibacter marinus]
MANTALVTGASSGIGRALAEYHAQQGGDLIITARRKPALDALKGELEAKYGIRVTVIENDLGNSDGAQQLYAKVKNLDTQVDILVNNAGFGGHGTFLARDLGDDLAMIDLNVAALVALTHLIGKDMKSQGAGKMLHVGSTAGFIPGPQQATYFATKAFVNSFSQAIDHEMRPHGVTSTVLCPGYVHTEFAQVAALEGTGLVKQKGATAPQVAKIGYDAMMAGKLVIVNEFALGFMLNWIIPFLPRRMVLKITDKMQTK